MIVFHLVYQHSPSPDKKLCCVFAVCCCPFLNIPLTHMGGEAAGQSLGSRLSKFGFHVIGLDEHNITSYMVMNNKYMVMNNKGTHPLKNFGVQ